MNTYSYQCSECGYIQSDPEPCRKCLPVDLINEAIAANNKWWVTWGENSIYTFCQKQLCEKRGVNQYLASIIREELELYWTERKKELEVKE